VYECRSPKDNRTIEPPVTLVRYTSSPHTVSVQPSPSAATPSNASNTQRIQDRQPPRRPSLPAALLCQRGALSSLPLISSRLVAGKLLRCRRHEARRPGCPRLLRPVCGPLRCEHLRREDLPCSGSSRPRCRWRHSLVVRRGASSGIECIDIARRGATPSAASPTRTASGGGRGGCPTGAT